MRSLRRVERSNYSAQALINAVVMSVPFRYQAASAAADHEATGEASMSQKVDLAPDIAARSRRRARAAVAGGDGPVRAGASACRREVARAHGGAVHAERREHAAVDTGGRGQRLQAVADAGLARAI